MSFELAALVVRVAALVVWTGVLVRTIRYHRGTPEEQTRRMAMTLLVWASTLAFTVGGLVPFGIVEIDVIRFIYTSLAGGVIITAVAILSLRDG